MYNKLTQLYAKIKTEKKNGFEISGWKKKFVP